MRYELRQALERFLDESPSPALSRVIDQILLEIEDLEQNTPGTGILEQVSALEKDRDDLTERVKALEEELELLSNQP